MLPNMYLGHTARDIIVVYNHKSNEVSGYQDQLYMAIITRARN